MVNKGFIYRGLKPVYWCAECESSLAEAEVEYKDHASYAIYVKFPVANGQGKIPGEEPVYFSSGPQHLGLCLPMRPSPCTHSLVYVLVDTEAGKLIMAEERLAP
jgi:isoleucyl-tRNA synthetase